MRRLMACMGVAAMIGLNVWATELDYQGRIATEGRAYSGKGHFKFLLHDGEGKALWANDGALRMREPGDAVNLEVTDGLFSVSLGSADAGMAPIAPVSFHAPTVQLRTWFSTRSRGPYEQLKPDVAVRTIDYGRFNTGDTIVVDDDGNGDFSDLQEAVNTVATNAAYSVVLVMPGQYALSKPLTVPGGGKVIVRGLIRDAVSIENRRGEVLIPFNGTLESLSLIGQVGIDDRTAAPGYALTLRDVSVSGATRLARTGSLKAASCVFTADPSGAVMVAGGGSVLLRDCELRSTQGPGLTVGGALRRVRVVNSDITGYSGVLVAGSGEGGSAVVELTGCRVTGATGGASIGLLEGAEAASVRLMNSVLSSAVSEGITLVAPTQTLANGNVIVSGE